MKFIKWGFIGCGEVAEKKSGPAFSQVDGSSVVAVMSPDATEARGYAERHNIAKWYSDAQELIDDDDINAVYISTPPATHATYAIMSMKAGKPVYVEKPLAASYDDCTRVNRISEQTGVPCFVAYYRRYLPYFEKVREIIERGMIGNVVNVQLRYAGSSNFCNLAPHQLDLLQHLLGVITEARGISVSRWNKNRTDDSVSACFEFENRLPGSGSWCFVAHESAHEDRIILIGDRGSVSFSVFDYQPIRIHTLYGEESLAIANPVPVQAPLVRNVIEHLQGISVCQCTSVSATPVNWAMDRILGRF